VNEAVERVRNRPPRQTNYKTPATALSEPELQMLHAVEDLRAVSATIAGNMTLDPTAGLSMRIARVHGFDAQWPEMRAWKIAAGRAISAAEHRTAAAVMLVSQRVAARLWPDQSA